MEYESIIYSLITVIILYIFVYFIMNLSKQFVSCNGDNYSTKNIHKCYGDVCCL